METFATGALRATFADNVRRRRMRLGWSQERLAHEADLHRVYLNRLEAKSRNVTLDIVERLAHAFGVDPIELLLQPRMAIGTDAEPPADNS